MPRIDQFISAAALALADFIPLGQGTNTRKTTLEALKTFFTGDLSSQLSERVYKSKNSLPVADSSLSATDFASNIATLYTALSAFTNFSIFVSSSNYPNFSAGISKKLLDDLGVSFSSAGGFTFEMTVNTNNAIPNKIFIYPNNSSRIFYVSYDSGVSVTKEITTDDTGWIQFTLLNGVLHYTTGAELSYRKIGNRVYIRGAVKNITAVSTVISNLPTGFRPAITVTTICAGTTTRQNRIAFSSNGDVRLDATTYTGTLTVDDWYPIFGSFLVD